MNGFGEERGQVVVVTALLLTALLIFAALVLDIGNAKQTGVGNQSAADAAASAGASQLSSSPNPPSPPTPPNAAQRYAADYAFDSLQQTRGSVVTCPADASSANTYCFQANSAGPLVYVTVYSGSPFPVTPADGTTPTSEISVRVCSTVATTFARIIKITSLRPCKSATADATGSASSGLPCGVCVITGGGEFGTALAAALEVTGNVPSPGVPNISVTVNGGTSNGIIVESSANGHTAGTAASVLTGSTKIATNGTINVSGFAYTNGPSIYSPAATANSYTLDPLSGTTPPAVSGSPSCTPTSTPCAFTSDDRTQMCNGTISPGVYKSITVEGATCTPPMYNLTMLPGTYVIEGAFDIGAGTSVLGNGVTLYFTCTGYTQTNTAPCASPGTKGGYFDDEGNGTVVLSAPTSGSYQGLVMFYDRNDVGHYIYPSTDCGTPFVGNGATLSVTGTVYAKDAQICMEGDGASFNTLFVVGALAVKNSSGISDTVTASQQVPLSSGPSGTALVG